MDSRYYIQGINDNTCGLIALVNALKYNNKEVPSKRKLRGIISRYRIEYGMSVQDTFCIANELGLRLNTIKYDNVFIKKILDSGLPILISARLDRSKIMDRIKEQGGGKVGISLDFKLSRIKAREFLVKESNEEDKRYSGSHSFLIIKNSGNRYRCLNIGGCGELELMEGDFIITTGPNGERWDSTYFITEYDIKVEGLPNFDKGVMLGRGN